MRVTFWGVRGSVPWATPASIGYGCNTPCVEVRNDETGDVLILDAGSGIVGIGQSLESRPRPVPVLLTHYHWDHMQGLPFFDPFYKTGYQTEIWAPRLGQIDAAWVATIFQNPFYPVPYDTLPSKPSLHLLNGQETEVGGFRVGAQPLNHPGGALAFRVRGASGDLVYATDHELGNTAYDEALAAFERGAGAIILDAHFTPEELPAHRGWGHSSWRQCAEFAAVNDIGQLWLFHHRPGRTDAEVAAIETAADTVFAGTRAAREGLTFEV